MKHCCDITLVKTWHSIVSAMWVLQDLTESAASLAKMCDELAAAYTNIDFSLCSWAISTFVLKNKRISTAVRISEQSKQAMSLLKVYL